MRQYAAVWNGFGYVGYETAIATKRGLPIVAEFFTVDALEAYIVSHQDGAPAKTKWGVL